MDSVAETVRLLRMLNIPVSDGKGGTRTLRKHLKEILAAVWMQGGHFNIDAPLGHYLWRGDIYNALAEANGAEAVRYEEADKLILKLIDMM